MNLSQFSGAWPRLNEDPAYVVDVREWQRCPICLGSGALFDPIMGRCNAGATMTCHRCLGTGTIERPR